MQFEQFVLAHEPELRLGSFAVIFAIVALWEVVAPRRTLTLPKALRWRANLSLVVLNTVLLRFMTPVVAVSVAAFCTAHGWGVLNHGQLPLWLAVPLALIAMDFVIWLQHVVFHAIPVLWRLHRVHHTDLDYDLTTGSRFHPIEIALSMGVKVSVVIALGPPVMAVVIFELLLNAAAMFNHGNIALPIKIDRILRWFIVTPDMHRVHHSMEVDETNANFGFNLPWWDRLFGTYRDQPRGGHLGMDIGIRHQTDWHHVARLGGMLAMPFATPAKPGPAPQLGSID